MKPTITLTLALLCLGLPLIAGAETETGLEWEEPLTAFTASITGPVGFSIAILGMVGCGVALLWGGEMSDFLRRMLLVLLAAAVILAASSIVRSLFDTSELIVEEGGYGFENNNLATRTA